MTEMIQWFGWAGLMLVNLAYLPQLVKTYRLKKAWQISPLFYAMIATGICSYLVYAVWREDPVFIVSNTVGLVQPLLMICFWMKWGRRNE